jgi:hypothetical protein
MNVVIKTAVQAYNIDAYNRTAVCSEDIANGSVFELLKYSEADGEEMVWEATAPAADTAKGLWMATSPEVVITKGFDGSVYKGLTPDPRAFVNIAGHMIDATFLAVGDMIEMTADGIEDAADKDYLVVDAGKFTLKAADAATTGLSLRKVGTSRLHIGQAGIAKSAVATYKYVVEIN